MELEQEQIRNINSCYICGSPEMLNSHYIFDSFIKYKDSFVSFFEVILKTLNFEVSSIEQNSRDLLLEMNFSLQISKQECSSKLCELCREKLTEFYYFKMDFLRSEQSRTKHTELSDSYHEKFKQLDNEIEDKVVYNTVQIVRRYVEKFSIAEIKEYETDKKLVITPASTSQTFHNRSISIKSEPMEIKIEPIDVHVKEEREVDTLFFKTFTDSSEELTNSSTEVSLSRLPAFEESTYFDGDKFVLRSKVPPKKLKEPKKRQRKPELWATNVQKKLRNSGKRYRSAKGYIVEARSMAAPCSCRQDCGSKVNEKNRLMNFSRYWELGETTRKRKFIFDHIKLERPMRAMNKSRALSRLIIHFLDVMNSDGTIDKVRVCKTMFLNTFDISNTVVMTAVKLNSQYFDV